MSSIKTINPNPSPILKIEFGLYWLGGGEGNRTPVRKSLAKAFYECIQLFNIPASYR